MIEVIYLDPARDEMIEAARWYDDQQRGVGDEFLNEVDRAVDRLLSDPEARPTLAANVFRQRVDRFPFDLVFNRDRARLSSSRWLITAANLRTGEGEIHAVLASGVGWVESSRPTILDASPT